MERDKKEEEVVYGRERVGETKQRSEDGEREGGEEEEEGRMPVYLHFFAAHCTACQALHDFFPSRSRRRRRRAAEQIRRGG